MESRSRSRRRSRARHHLGPRGGADRLSALTDDLLLEVLVHVGCARTAARFGLLSHRWRGLWAGLPEVVLHDVPFHSLEPALALVSRPALSRLDIRVDKRHWPNASRVTSLLRGAQRVSPEELVFTIPSLFCASYKSIDLPAFHRATSIRLDSGLLRVRPPPAGEGDFSALQTLSLSGCIVQDFHAMVSRCPRLRVLRYRTHSGECSDYLRIKVHSASLEELVVESGSDVKHSIDIVTPVLKQLTSSFLAIPGLSISILAPMLEHCSFAYRHLDWIWGLRSLSLIVTGIAHARSLEIYASFVRLPPLLNLITTIMRLVSITL
ncbi:hypothetical protein ACQ4PT_002794 [Festuca glaucescens]